ncbi:hypothetical protein GUJ93_ZPchr0001g32553 [Zizania palustris]|uniref:Uncharacterized protein n=1 Tax=Zizania palustris TaxID=103762 RepID=A0A8J5VD58_ZIZPA|nr:hypothetical protein GUJ93_ZPchr0001g32553 [Zizania palustris]
MGRLHISDSAAAAPIATFGSLVSAATSRRLRALAHRPARPLMPLLLRGGSLLRFFECRCGLPRANLSCRKFALTRLNSVMAETRTTYSRRAASKNTEIKKDEELALEKEDVAQSKLEIEQIRTDPGRIQSMTVKELKELTRFSFTVSFPYYQSMRINLRF